MMIELIIKNHLDEKLVEGVYLEKQNEEQVYIVIQKTGGGKSNHLPSATFAFQSYHKSKFEAAKLNERVKEAVESLIEQDEIRGLSLNSDYDFTDTTTKEYRYQAVYDIRHY